MMQMPTLSIALEMERLGLGNAGNLAQVRGEWSILIQEDNININRAIVLRLSSWKDPEPNVNYDYPKIIMHMRGLHADTNELYNRANLIKNAFHSKDPVVLGGDSYTYFNMARDIQFLPLQEGKSVQALMEFDLVVNSGDAQGTNRNLV